MEICIRKATINDVEAIFGLVQELAVYEKAPEKVSNSIDQMKKEGFGENPAFESFVAELNGKLLDQRFTFIAIQLGKEGLCIWMTFT